MEQEISGISKFPEKRKTSRGFFSKRFSGNFLFYSILNRNFRKFWLNGTRPRIGRKRRSRSQNMVKILGSALHTPTQFFWEYSSDKCKFWRRFCRHIYINIANFTLIGYNLHYANSSLLKQYRFRFWVHDAKTTKCVKKYSTSRRSFKSLLCVGKYITSSPLSLTLCASETLVCYFYLHHICNTSHLFAWLHFVLWFRQINDTCRRIFDHNTLGVFSYTSISGPRETKIYPRLRSIVLWHRSSIILINSNNASRALALKYQNCEVATF